jgi:hypothetical protein
MRSVSQSTNATTAAFYHQLKVWEGYILIRLWFDMLGIRVILLEETGVLLVAYVIVLPYQCWRQGGDG